MRSRLFLVSSLSIVILGAGPLVGCADEEESPNTESPDAGTPSTNVDSGVPSTGNDAGSGETDSGKPVDDGGDETLPAAITPAFAKKIPDALNPYGAAFGSDGKLYISGAKLVVTDPATTPPTTERRLAVWRFDASGVADATFGDGGVVTVAVPGDETSYDLVELKNGDFVVQASSGGKVYLTRLAKGSGGAFTFGTPAVVEFDWADGDYTSWPGTSATPPTVPQYSSWDIGLDKSDPAAEKIVVFAHGAPAKVAAGTTQRTDNDRWVARVLTTEGFPKDPAFNGGKAYGVDADGKGIADNARRGVVEADGTIVSSGYTNFGEGLRNHVVLIRLGRDGKPDANFGFGTTGTGISGQSKFNPFIAVTNGASEAYGIVRQASGRYVTTGYGTSDFASPTKSPDVLSFGVKDDGLDPKYGKLGSFAVQSEVDSTAGLATGPFADQSRALALLPDDRTVHAGRYDGFASLMVLTKDGALDRSAGHGGVIQYNVETQFYNVVVSSDGKRIFATAASVSTTSTATPPVTTTSALLVGLTVDP